MIYVGTCGKNSERGIFKKTSFSKQLLRKENCPDSKPIPETHLPIPLVNRLKMRPYLKSKEGAQQEEENIFNYRLNRSRNTSGDSVGTYVK
ncbi:hypothetical protein PR048_019950, partial [Dryococelus australis]